MTRWSDSVPRERVDCPSSPSRRFVLAFRRTDGGRRRKSSETVLFHLVVIVPKGNRCKYPDGIFVISGSETLSPLSLSTALIRPFDDRSIDHLPIPRPFRFYPIFLHLGFCQMLQICRLWID